MQARKSVSLLSLLLHISLGPIFFFSTIRLTWIDVSRFYLLYYHEELLQMADPFQIRRNVATLGFKPKTPLCHLNSDGKRATITLMPALHASPNEHK